MKGIRMLYILCSNSQYAIVMAGVKIFLRLFAILIFSTVFSENLEAQDIVESRRGYISAQGNLAPGYMFQSKEMMAYVGGDVEIFPADKFGVMGSSIISFSTKHQDEMGILQNHGIFFGGNYHFRKLGQFDPYVGFAPGIGLVQVAYAEDGELFKTSANAVPLASALIGFNFYIGSVFHFFLRMQAVSGEVFSTLPSPMRLDELKIMGGLGWNLRVWKPQSEENTIPVLRK